MRERKEAAVVALIDIMAEWEVAKSEEIPRRRVGGENRNEK